MQFCNESANYQIVVISGQKELNMSPTTAINEFAKAVVRERRVPFDIRSENKGGEALRILRATAKKNGIQDMSLDEINEEVRKAREGIGD